MSLGLIAACVSTFAASVEFPINAKPLEDLSQNLKVVNVCNLTDYDLNEIMQGHRPDVAVEFSAHTALPISFFLKGDLVNLVENQGNFGQIEVKQTFYARNVQETLLLSSNLTDWKPLLEFITGNASISLSIQDDRPSIVFGAEANRRT